MLRLAVKAGLPLIAVRTRDTLNAPAVIEHLVGKAPEYTDVGQAMKGSDHLWYTVGGDIVNVRELYESLVKMDSTLIVLNQEDVTPAFFDAGTLPVPEEFVRNQLIGVGIDRKAVDRIMPVLGGLTYKEIGEVVRLCQVQSGALTQDGIIEVRRRCFSQVRGLQLVDPSMPYYAGEAKVTRFARWAGKYLLKNDERLRPRGLLLDGVPGTGKTSAAKYLARVIGVPLFRLDLGAIKGKWVGESEHAMSDALAQVGNEAPCILLLDEVEKLFRQRSDEGTTEGLLASLLWFLSEHDSKVLTVMTTNGKDQIPPELYRHGRVDEVITLDGMGEQIACAFAETLMVTFMPVGDREQGIIQREIHAKIRRPPSEPPKRLTQAEVTSMVKHMARRWLE